MTEEMQALLVSLSEDVKELQQKLTDIDDLLGSPQAGQFSDHMLDAMVNDVLRYQMMMDDIATWAARELAKEFGEKIRSELMMRTLRHLLGKG